MTAISPEWGMRMPPSTLVFVDTSGWVRLLDRANSLHSEADAAFRRIIIAGQRFITTNYVFAELVPVLSVRTKGSREQTLAQIAIARQNAGLQTVHIDESHDLLAWAMLQRFRDKTWSLVDAASFVIMQERGVTEALTSDHHFEQAGFLRLLSP